MFGANLSKVATRKVDKKGDGAASAKPRGGGTSLSSKSAEYCEFAFLDVRESVDALSAGVEGISVEDSSEEDMKTRKRLPQGSLPILYSEERSATEEVLLEFFCAGAKMLLMKENIVEIVQESNATNTPLYLQSMNFQKDVLERNFQIEREYGCKQLSMVYVNFPDNVELRDASAKFMMAAMESYTEQVKYRAAQRFKKIRQNTGKDDVLRSAGGMSKQDLMEFFEAVCSTTCLPQTRAIFDAEFKKSGKFETVAMKSVAIQHRLLELVGVEWKYGVECLNKIGQVYSGDRDLSSKFMSFQVSCEIYCRMACMTEEELTRLLEQCPEHVRSMPHIFFAQQRMAQQAQQQQQQQAQQGGPMGQPDTSSLTEEQKKLFDRLSSEEGSTKVATLFQRVNSVKDEIISDIEKMNGGDRQAYFENFGMEEVAKTVGKIKPEDAYAGLEAFIDMDEADLKKVLTMNAVFNTDTRAGGSLMKNMKDNEDVKGTMVQFSNTIRLVTNSMMQAQQQIAAQQGTPMPPGAGQAPGQGTMNQAPRPMNMPPPAPKPAGDSMDR
jgi:hypothetical protein